MRPACPSAVSLEDQVRDALAEDHAQADATGQAVLPAGAVVRATLVAKANGVLAGRDWAAEAFRQLCPEGQFSWQLQDGDLVQPGTVVLQACAEARPLLAAERTALNFLQQLSGVATLTAQAVDAVGPGIQVLDTRKTVPGLRDAQKAAVRAGGGRNHRRDLADQLLLKENHFAYSGLDYAETVRRAVAAADGRVVGAEAETEEQALAALGAGADYVLLDNFSIDALRASVARLRADFPTALIEVSGGLTLASLPQLRGTGIDRVSIGALTHSAPSLDFSLRFDGPLP